MSNYYMIKFLDGSMRKFETLAGENLQEADLQGADLQEADLRGADLREANLRVADLQGANLQGAKGILSATLGQHMVVAFQSGVNISCKSYSYDDWLADGFMEELGKAHHYSNQQIKNYKAFIKFAANQEFGDEE